MKIKHTHPAFKDEQERKVQLKDTQKTCIAKLRALRERAFGEKVGTA